MRHFSQHYLGFDDDAQQGATWHDNADYDDGATVAQPLSADEIRALENAEVYEQQITALVHEAEPIIAVFANISAMLLNGIDTEAGKFFGGLAQDTYDMTRWRIERDAGIDEG